MFCSDSFIATFRSRFASFRQFLKAAPSSASKSTKRWYPYLVSSFRKWLVHRRLQLIRCRISFNRNILPAQGRRKRRKGRTNWEQMWDKGGKEANVLMREGKADEGGGKIKYERNWSSSMSTGYLHESSPFWLQSTNNRQSRSRWFALFIGTAGQLA